MDGWDQDLNRPLGGRPHCCKQEDVRLMCHCIILLRLLPTRFAQCVVAADLMVAGKIQEATVPQHEHKLLGVGHVLSKLLVTKIPNNLQPGLTATVLIH